MKIFTEHPATVGETYGRHLLVSLSFAGEMILGGFACLAHAIVPFLFKKTGSNAIRRLHGRMVTHRDRTRHAPAVVGEVGERSPLMSLPCQTKN